MAPFPLIVALTSNYFWPDIMFSRIHLSDLSALRVLPFQEPHRGQQDPAKKKCYPSGILIYSFANAVLLLQARKSREFPHRKSSLTLGARNARRSNSTNFATTASLPSSSRRTWAISGNPQHHIMIILISIMIMIILISTWWTATF